MGTPRSLWSIAVFVLGTAGAASASTLGLDVISSTEFAPGPFHTIGWEFQVNSPITVDGLGLFDVDPQGLGESHEVGLWTDTGTLLASATVNSGSTFVGSTSTAGDWLFENITPVTLLPGSYVIGGFFLTSVDSVVANATIMTAPAITFLQSRASTGTSFGLPGVYGLVDPGVFGANFSIAEEISSVPEPTSLLLLGSGVATLAVRRLRRRNRI